jgi:hypothetical protein
MNVYSHAKVLNKYVQTRMGHITVVVKKEHLVMEAFAQVYQISYYTVITL